MRITGLATGLDMDKIVSDSMKPYRFKIDQTQQKRDIVEMKQMLYRDVINDSRDLYNKYFDVSKPDSLLLSSNYGVTKFTSSNEGAVTVSAGAGAISGNYKIEGTNGTSAKAVVKLDEIVDNKITINDKEFKLLENGTEKEKATDLNKQLKDAGIKVTVRYSDFAGGANGVNQKGFVFETTEMGKNSGFTIGGTFANSGTMTNGTNSTAGITTEFTLDELKAAKKISINGKEIEIDIAEGASNEEIEKLLNEKLKSEKVSVKLDGNNLTFTNLELGDTFEPKIQIGENIGKFEKGIDGEKSTNVIEFKDIKGQQILINGEVINIPTDMTDEEITEYLVSKGVDAKINNGNLMLTANKPGADIKMEMKIFNGSSAHTVTPGTDTNITITDSKGGVYTHKGTSNTVTLDGITFKFTGEIPKDGVNITGKTDTKDTKDKLVSFVNDYNTLIEKLNKMTMEKPNKKYQPLTEEQKKEMSESEVKLWNEKVKQGQLSRDSDITRLSNSMKSIMSSMSGALEKIGISPVADYQGTKHGTLKIDESKLDAALENNAEEVMNLLIGTRKDKDGKEIKGVMHQLKDVLYNETVTVTASLIKKAGIDNSATSSNNDLTRSIEKYNKKMADLEKDFARREQALYSKYARLEVSMNKYNSQQSMMAQQFGGQ